MSYKTARVSKCAPRNGTKRQKKNYHFQQYVKQKLNLVKK